MYTVPQSPRHSRRSALGIVGVTVLAAALTGGVAAAQDPQPTPESGTSVVVEAVPMAGPQGGTVVMGGGVVPAGPGIVQLAPGGCATWQTVTVGPDGVTQEQGGGGDGTCIQGGPSVMGPLGPGGVMVGGTMGPVAAGSVTIAADPARLVTVTAIDGATVTLTTVDGWTKAVDTTNVVITLDRTTLTTADLAVGDTLQVDQTRNANDTYTITGLELVLPRVLGVVATVGTDSFSVTQMDGTTTTVHITDTTKWPVQMPGSGAPGLSGVQTGDFIVAQGKLEADGSMDASSVTTGGMSVGSDMSGSGMMIPPSTPVPATSPAPSPQG